MSSPLAAANYVLRLLTKQDRWELVREFVYQPLEDAIDAVVRLPGTRECRHFIVGDATQMMRLYSYDKSAFFDRISDAMIAFESGEKEKVERAKTWSPYQWGRT